MLLFYTQIPQPEQKKKNPDGSFANVIQEVIERIAGVSPPKENFMKPTNEGSAQKNFADYERQMLEKAEKFAGPPPNAAGKDHLQVTIDEQKHQIKVLQKYSELISDKKQLEEWRMKKS